MDDLVGIGADHGHVALLHLGEQRLIVGHRFEMIIEKAGAQHDLGFGEAGKSDRQVDGQVMIAIRTQMEDALAGAHFGQTTGDIAR